MNKVISLLLLGVVFVESAKFSEKKPERTIDALKKSDNELQLGPKEQAMLEALVDQAIAQEELARQVRSSAQHKSANIKRFSSSLPSDTPAPEYGPPLSYDKKEFSLWTFKKAILNAILQAIKAITGGVIALNGQLIKVKGHLVAAKGKLLETKGDAITEFGKHLATKALLTPMHVSTYDHKVPTTSYGPPPSGPTDPYPAAIPPSSYGPPPSAPTGPYAAAIPPSSYGPPPGPSAPSHSYGPPASASYTGHTSSFGGPSGFGSPVQSFGSYSGHSAPSSFDSSFYGPPPPASPALHSYTDSYHPHSIKRETTVAEKKTASDGVQPGGLVILKSIELPTLQSSDKLSLNKHLQDFSKTSVKRIDRQIYY
ncbi:uncharacterized protein [Rhodnius prolixus]|uniref:uncharacterized protein n=1 Tax=Rhodnius prolixus TaxID=13249 RepID=UPI003D18D094